MSKKIKAEEYMNWDKNLAKELTPLEAYENLCSHLDYDSDDYMFNGNYEEDNEVVMKALIALEIIKENFIITEQRQVQHKNLWNLTQEQIKLLKDVLSDGK